MVDIAIQVVNYKTKEYLTGCINSIIGDLKNSEISHKILVLENNSGDDLTALKQKYKKDKIEFYYSDRNLGFGGGHNFLSRKTQSRYIFVLNPDIIVGEGAVKILFKFMESHPPTGMCGPRILLPEKNFLFHKNIFWPKVFVWKEFTEKFLKLKILKNINHLEYDPIAGSALFIRKEAFKKVGGFDENLFLYFEEGDLCNSLKNKGYKIFFIYDAVVIHLYGKSSMSKSEKVRYFKESRRYFYKKWYGEEKARKMLAKEEISLKDKILEKFL